MTDPTDYTELVKWLKGYATDPMWADHAEVPKVLLTRTSDTIEALVRGQDESRDAHEADARAYLAAVNRYETASARVAELEGALNTRDLFINPNLLDLYADEIDCSGNCEHIWTDASVNFSECRKAEHGEYCPNDLAETLRALAVVARNKETNQ